MPSHKKFNDKMCVYCATQPATTEDHVFARGFFVEARRDNPLKCRLASLATK